MQKRVCIRFAFLTLWLLLLTVPVFIVWQAWNQEKLDQALIAAIKHNDPVAVQSSLEHGADG